MVQYRGINSCKRDIEIIVSLSSCEDNFKYLPATLESILNQELKADRIILWLNEKEYDLVNLPYQITKFVKDGLEIRFVKDLRTYNKTIYPIKEYPESIIVTAEDDIYYPAEWLKRLYMSYIANPKDIQTHKTIQKSVENADYKYIPLNLGGILYPPNCFTKEALREDIFLKYAPSEDYIWFWIMALVHNRKIRVVKNHIGMFVYTNLFKNLFGRRIKYDYSQALNNLMKFYGENVRNKLEK